MQRNIIVDVSLMNDKRWLMIFISTFFCDTLDVLRVLGADYKKNLKIILRCDNNLR